MASRKRILLKLVVLGESGVGKTSLLIRYVENRFSMKTKSTIGANFLTKRVEVEDQVATCQIWDTAGQERFQGLGTAFYRGSDGVLFVFDCTQKSTFEALEGWRSAFLIQVNQEGNKDFPMVVLCNKVDLVENRTVSTEDVRNWCSPYNIHFFETSAKDGKNVEAAFKRITELVLERMEPEDAKYATETITLEREAPAGAGGAAGGAAQDAGCC